MVRTLSTAEAACMLQLAAADLPAHIQEATEKTKYRGISCEGLMLRADAAGNPRMTVSYTTDDDAFIGSKQQTAIPRQSEPGGLSLRIRPTYDSQVAYVNELGVRGWWVNTLQHSSAKPEARWLDDAVETLTDLGIFVGNLPLRVCSVDVMQLQRGMAGTVVGVKSAMVSDDRDSLADYLLQHSPEAVDLNALHGMIVCENEVGLNGLRVTYTIDRVE